MPYKSDAQRRKFHAMLKRGEISKETVDEWDEASKGKKLPERVGNKRTKKRTTKPRGGIKRGKKSNKKRPKGAKRSTKRNK